MSVLGNQSAVNSSRSFWAPFGSGGGSGSNFTNITVSCNANIANLLTSSITNQLDIQTSNIFALDIQGQTGQFVSLGIDDSLTVNNVNLNTINSNPYPPTLSLRGLGATVDIEGTLSNNGVPEYAGQNQYFNLNVSTTVTDPQLSIDPGGTVGGNYIAFTGNSVGAPPIGIYAQGTPIDVRNPNSESLTSYIYSGSGASLQFSGWHRIGAPYTAILNDSMASYPFGVSDSNMAGPNVSPIGDYKALCLGGCGNLLSFTGGFTFQSGAQTADDALMVYICDSNGKTPVGGVVPMPLGVNTTVPFSFTGLSPAPSGSFAAYDHISYRIIAPSNALYAVEITAAGMLQL